MTTTTLAPGTRCRVLEHPSSHGDGFATGTVVRVTGPEVDSSQDGVLVTTRENWQTRSGDWDEGVTAYVMPEWLEPIDAPSQPVTRRDHEFFVGDRVRFVETYDATLRRTYASGTEGVVTRAEAWMPDGRHIIGVTAPTVEDGTHDTSAWARRLELVVPAPPAPARERRDGEFFPGDRVRMLQRRLDLQIGDIGTIVRASEGYEYDPARPDDTMWVVRSENGTHVLCWSRRFELVEEVSQPVTPETREEDGVTLHLVRECRIVHGHSDAPHMHLTYDDGGEGWNSLNAPPDGGWHYTPGVFGRGRHVGTYVRAAHAVTAGSIEAVPTPEGLVEAVADTAKATVLRWALDAMDSVTEPANQDVETFRLAVVGALQRRGA